MRPTLTTPPGLPRGPVTPGLRLGHVPKGGFQCGQLRRAPGRLAVIRGFQPGQQRGEPGRARPRPAPHLRREGSGLDQFAIPPARLCRSAECSPGRTPTGRARPAAPPVGPLRRHNSAHQVLRGRPRIQPRPRGQQVGGQPPLARELAAHALGVGGREHVAQVGQGQAGAGFGCEADASGPGLSERGPQATRRRASVFRMMSWACKEASSAARLDRSAASRRATPSRTSAAASRSSLAAVFNCWHWCGHRAQPSQRVTAPTGRRRPAARPAPPTGPAAHQRLGGHRGHEGDRHHEGQHEAHRHRKRRRRKAGRAEDAVEQFGHVLGFDEPERGGAQRQPDAVHDDQRRDVQQRPQPAPRPA